MKIKSITKIKDRESQYGTMTDYLMILDDNGVDKSVTSPISLIISAFAPVYDVRKSLTPQIKTDAGDTSLILIDLGCGKNRLARAGIIDC